MDRDTGGAPPLGPAVQPNAVYDGKASLAPVLDALGVPRRRPVLVLVGWADAGLPDDTRDAIDLLMRTVVVPVCRDEGAVVISGGTDAGVMAALGKAMAEQAPDVVLIGVSPDACLIGMGAPSGDQYAASPEPRHRLVRTPGSQWGDEGPILVRVAEDVASGLGVVVLAIGGGVGTRRELALAARRRWPVLFVTGHGGTSDAVSRALGVQPLLEPPSDAKGSWVNTPSWKGAAPDTKDVASAGWDLRDGSELAAARDAGCHTSVALGERAALDRALRWRLSGDDVLKDAWTRFATADRVAVVRKTPTIRMAVAVLALATLTVLFAVALGVLSTRPAWAMGWSATGGDVLKGLVTALPLSAAVLLGLMDRRSRTGSWIDLRAAAESMLREIYRSRAQTGRYGAAGAPVPLVLGDALAQIDTLTNGRSLFPSKAIPDRSTWPPQNLWGRVPASDSLVGPLTAEDYDLARAADQLAHYERAARAFERQATRLSTAIFVVAAAAAFLLALSWRWRLLTVAAAGPASLAAALVSWREYRQRDARAEAMLATCVAIRAARGRWLALQPQDRETPGSLATFVGEVEDALAAEGTDWERGLRQAHQAFADRHRAR